MGIASLCKSYCGTSIMDIKFNIQLNNRTFKFYLLLIAAVAAKEK